MFSASGERPHTTFANDAGIGGAVIPFLTQGLLDNYSYRTTMIAIVSV